MTPIEELLIKLLKIPSVSGQEKEIGDFLVSELKDFKVKKQFVAKGRFNVIAQKGKSDVWIAVHMDTVPGIVPIKITRDRIFGRGAIDNKGNIAGAIMAAKKLDDINLLFTVGEEDDFIGAKKAKIKKGKFIVMEPTKMQIIDGQRGLIAFTVFAKGKQMHSSLNFEKEESAVYNLINILKEMYGKNWTAFNAIISEGGEADNVVAPLAKARILIRPKNKKEYNGIISFIKKVKTKNIAIKIDGTTLPCRSSLIKTGKAVPFFSEMAFFKNSLLFGVGDISNAHTVNEYVRRKDLNQLEEKLINLVKKISN